jgi:hypothetical protein
MKYKIKNVTPESMSCGLLGFCPTIYEGKIKNVTPKELDCTIIGCPAIYEGKIKNVTPKSLSCIAIGCPAIYEGKIKNVTPKSLTCAVIGCSAIYEGKEVYLIIGKTVNPAEAGLEKKVGEGESLIEVPKALIDKRKR